MSKITKELRGMKDPALQQRNADLNKELIKLYAQTATGTTPKNPIEIKNTKKTIARIKTILQERNLQNLKKKDAGSKSTGKSIASAVSKTGEDTKA